ncbi:MAG: hypothetical protein LH649_15445 [Pseudanabaena sp. CAN_BIN31]|nr:hypothetical protein [Pseudanabaena sp. CAN_BIN31]
MPRSDTFKKLSVLLKPSIGCIDFLIDYDLEKTTPWFPVGLIRDLEMLLNTKVDVVTVEGLKNRIREQVWQESINL